MCTCRKQIKIVIVQQVRQYSISEAALHAYQLLPLSVMHTFVSYSVRQGDMCICIGIDMHYTHRPL